MSEALRKAAQAALTALENLDGIDTETECVTICVGDEINALRAALAEPEQSEPVPSDGWLQEGSLLYRLTNDRHAENRDEINVTMADGSRSEASRTRRAGELLDRIRETRREPLSDEQIQAIRAECANTPPDKACTAYGWAINFARAIEQAHGIIGEKT